MKFFANLHNNPQAWLLLAFSALVFEGCALYFQYILNLEPCIMCIYQRVAIFGILFAGIIGFIGSDNITARILAFASWGLGAIWGLVIALEHVEMQTSSMSFLFSCEVVPNFPSWAPLHEWLPSIFAATGDCGKISWQFLGYSMPEWMIIVFATYSLIWLVVLASTLKVYKRL
ncbi:disulfide bond formation protein DsbB [Thalassotalea eurytherma]|uniref:Disulfide bond formation protein B n=1 Tax=Thalassotalea eurytherma TaxID=1144278 RepID=A0ABQ6H9Q4_9GAMM|nr:disulfide bond formation protein DsbB [Thalassotalea eurytherma]GLX83181.1 disulfide bond formation protein B [Thalassotalea eurytherma]